MQEKQDSKQTQNKDKDIIKILNMMPENPQESIIIIIREDLLDINQANMEVIQIYIDHSLIENLTDKDTRLIHQ